MWLQIGSVLPVDPLGMLGSPYPLVTYRSEGMILVALMVSFLETHNWRTKHMLLKIWEKLFNRKGKVA